MSKALIDKLDWIVTTLETKDERDIKREIRKAEIRVKKRKEFIDKILAEL